jgi:V/A-type H+-transporting ATPase subunit C
MAREDVTPRKGGVDDYGYINARVRAMGTVLLANADLERLMKADGLEALKSLLSSTDYGSDIKASEQKYAKGMKLSEVLMDGLKENFFRTMAKVYFFLGGEPAELANIFFYRWDVFNLKTLIRGKQANLHPAQIIQSLFFVGNLAQDKLEKLAKKKDMNELINALLDGTHPIVTSLRAEFELYLVTQNLAELELAMEKWFYRNALDLSASGGEGVNSARQFLREEIDIVNAVTCLRLTQLDVVPSEISKFYVPGGLKITQQDFNNLITKNNVNEIFSLLQRIPTFREGLQDRIELFKKQGDVGIFERLFEANLIRKAISSARGDSLGFGILLSYFKRKYNELVNLRLILRAVEFDLPMETIRQELVFV